MRTDFEIDGPAATHGHKTCYDLTIRAPVSADMLSRLIPSSPDTLTNKITQAREEMKAALDTFCGEKEALYKDNVSPIHFEAVVFSLGGTIGGRTQHLIDHWRKNVPLFSNCLELISLTLLRARCEHFDVGPQGDQF